MKITKDYLRQVIKEELAKTLNESLDEGVFDNIKQAFNKKMDQRRAKRKFNDKQHELADRFFDSLYSIKRAMKEDEFEDFQGFNDKDLTWFKNRSGKDYILDNFERANKAYEEFGKLYHQANPKYTEVSTGILLLNWADDALKRKQRTFGFDTIEQAKALRLLFRAYKRNKEKLEDLAHRRVSKRKA